MLNYMNSNKGSIPPCTVTDTWQNGWFWATELVGQKSSDGPLVDHSRRSCQRARPRRRRGDRDGLLVSGVQFRCKLPKRWRVFRSQNLSDRSKNDRYAPITDYTNGTTNGTGPNQGNVDKNFPVPNHPGWYYGACTWYMPFNAIPAGSARPWAKQ